jgi:hypothetical protein
LNQIDTISDDANQLIQVALDDGSAVQLTLIYGAAIERWQISVLATSLEVDGLILCTFGNILRPWISLINFGIACTSIDGGDPVFIDDFSTGRCSLFVLNQDDVAAVEAAIGGS